MYFVLPKGKAIRYGAIVGEDAQAWSGVTAVGRKGEWHRLAVKSDGVLLSHDDVTPGTGDLRIMLNKSAAAKDVGFTFQDGFSARALFGLLGDDGVTVKVSPDGAVFHLALSIDKDTGHVGLGGATADANNALIVKGTAFLFDKETDDVRFTFNKATAGDDVALTFQTGYAARALFGLLGDDDFTVKVTADGANFFVGFVVERTSGRFKLPLAPKFSAYTNFDNYIAANVWTKVQFNNADSNDQNAFSGASNSFVAPFAGNYAIGFSLRFKANAAVPTKVRRRARARPRHLRRAGRRRDDLQSLRPHAACRRRRRRRAGAFRNQRRLHRERPLPLLGPFRPLIFNCRTNLRGRLRAASSFWRSR